jgi:hypothetical protein
MTVPAWTAPEAAKGAPKATTEATAKAGPQPDARVDSLLAMPAAQRRAELRKMAPEERRGLWMALKRTQLQRRGAPSRKNYREMPRRALHPQRAVASPQSVGTIKYDSGAFSTGFGGGAIVGNHFNTHTGIPVLASGTVSTVQAVVEQGTNFTQTTSNAGFVLLGPQTGGGGAMAIASNFTTATGTTDTLTFTGLAANYTGSSFYVLFGDFASSYIPVFGTGTTNGQGHHGVVGYTGGMGPNITGTFNLGGTLNGFVRSTGNIVPVELMSFDVG